MLGLDNILSDEKIKALQDMANTTDEASKRMKEASEQAERAADKMLEAARLLAK